MNLKNGDLLAAIESYKNQHGLKDYQMAKLCGMKSPSVYNSWKKGITKTLKAEYLLNFFINTNIDASVFLQKFKKQNYSDGNKDVKTEKVEDSSFTYTLSEYNAQQKEIERLNEHIQDLRKSVEHQEELLRIYKKRNS